MAKRAATACSASVSSLPSRTRGSSWPVAAAKAGAICLQGPHHEAQKSTTKGMSLLPKCTSKFAEVSGIGCPSNNTEPQRPHFPPALILSCGTRLSVAQAGQAIIVVSGFGMILPLGSEMGIGQIVQLHEAELDLMFVRLFQKAARRSTALASSAAGP